MRLAVFALRRRVHEFQDGLKLTPLSAWGSDYRPPEVPCSGTIDPTPPVDQVAALDAASFFHRLAALMVDNPPAGADAEALARFAAIGLLPGEPFTLDDLDPEERDAVAQAPEQVREGSPGRLRIRDQRRW